MNERIKQLLNEATSGHEQEYDSSKVRTVSFREMEIFAELIVAECATIADKDSSEPCASYGKLIKQHFGVNE